MVWVVRGMGDTTSNEQPANPEYLLELDVASVRVSLLAIAWLGSL